MPKILIIDDSKTDQFAVKTILENNGFDTVVAESGETGAAAAVQEQPDLILMDIVMPGMGGFHATRRLSKNPETKHIPIIMLSSKDQESDKVWARTQGARDYISKPPEEEILLKAIEQVLNGAG